MAVDCNYAITAFSNQYLGLPIDCISVKRGESNQFPKKKLIALSEKRGKAISPGGRY
jgi:hypothetical protein